MKNQCSIFIILFMILTSCYSPTVQDQNHSCSVYTFSIKNIDSTYRHLLNNNCTDSAIGFIKKILKDSSLLSDIHVSYLFTKLSSLELYGNSIGASKDYAKRSLKRIKGLQSSSDKLYDKILYDALMLIVKNNFIVNEYDSAIIVLDSLEGFLSRNLKGSSSNSVLPEVFYWKGLVYLEVGNYSKSKLYCRKGIYSLEQHSNRNCRIADFYSILGEIYIYEEDFEKAEAYQLKALNIIGHCYSDSSTYYAENLTTLGIYYYESKQFDNALSCFAAAHKIIKANYPPESPQFAFLYNNLGDVYCRKELYEVGISYYNDALHLFREYGFEQNAKIVIHNLGNAYKEMGNYSKAIEYYTLSLSYGKNNNFNRGIFPSYTYQHLGNIALSNKQYRKALDFLNKAIEQICHFEVDSIYFYKDSLENHLLSDVELLESLYTKGNIEYILYKNHDSIQLLQDAVESFRKALFLVELIRNKYLSEESKLQLNLIQSKLFTKNLISLVDLYNYEKNSFLDNELLKAIEYNKHSALRSLIISDGLLKKSGVSHQIIYLVDSLQTRIRHLKELSKHIIQNQSYNDSIFRFINGQLFTCLYAYDSLKHIIETKNPSFKLGFEYKSFGISDIQRLIDDSTVVINYGIADTLLLIIAISKHGYKIYHSAITENLPQLKDDFLKAIAFSNEELFRYYGQLLYKIFISPVIDFIKSYKHLIILPDGEFLSLPFGAFNTECSKDSIVYLIQEYSINYKYSLMLTNNRLSYNNVSGNRKYNIIFSGYAPLANKQGKQSSSNKDSSLLYSGYEIISISDIFKKSMKTTEMYFSNNASWDRMILGLEGSKFFHLATHSYSNTQNGKCYILLSERKTNFKNDPSHNILPKNKIFVADIAGVNINSDLVTISSCYTGVGKSIPGEGILSLARGFYYAGAKNILYSLWKISDLHTSKFMISFYNYINEGYSYSHALQKTKIDFIYSDFQLPHFWSGFVLLN